MDEFRNYEKALAALKEAAKAAGKVAEEAAETLLASKDGDKLHLVREMADLWFHGMVLLAFHGLRPGDVLDELARREGLSGHEEKKARSAG